MVAPSCCLEYRPTSTLLLIVFFIVFPLIYVSGRVTVCALTIVLRIFHGMGSFLLCEPDAEPTTSADKLAAATDFSDAEEHERRRVARRRRREQKALLKAQMMLLADAMGSQNATTSVVADVVSATTTTTTSPDEQTTTTTSLTTTLVGESKAEKSSDISDSLNSENEADDVDVVKRRQHHYVKTTVLGPAHNLVNGGSRK